MTSQIYCVFHYDPPLPKVILACPNPCINNEWSRTQPLHNRITPGAVQDLSLDIHKDSCRNYKLYIHIAKKKL